MQFNHPRSRAWSHLESSSTVTLATRCPTLMTTDQSERIYWCADHKLLVLLVNRELVTFPDDDQVENAEVGINDATTDRLALALASPAGAVAGVTLAEQQAHATMGQHALLHGEALLVVASADANHITLKRYRKQILISAL